MSESNVVHHNFFSLRGFKKKIRRMGEVETIMVIKNKKNLSLLFDGMCVYWERLGCDLNLGPIIHSKSMIGGLNLKILRIFI